MKYLFSLFLALSFTCVTAQATYYIDTLASNSDSARLRVVNVLPDGSEQTYSEPYDSLVNVLEYARILFVSGGYVDAFRSESPDEIVEHIKTAIPLRDGLGPNRESLFDLLVASGVDPVANDTSYYSSVEGVYQYIVGDMVYTSALCATTSGDIEIEREFGFLWFRIDDDFIDYSCYPLNENMFQLINNTGKIVDIYVREGDYWKSVKGCVFELKP